MKRNFLKTLYAVNTRKAECQKLMLHNIYFKEDITIHLLFNNDFDELKTCFGLFGLSSVECSHHRSCNIKFTLKINKNHILQNI